MNLSCPGHLTVRFMFKVHYKKRNVRKVNRFSPAVTGPCAGRRDHLRGRLPGQRIKPQLALMPTPYRWFRWGEGQPLFKFSPCSLGSIFHTEIYGKAHIEFHRDTTIPCAALHRLRAHVSYAVSVTCEPIRRG